MNKITKLFAFAALSVMANPAAIFADYPSAASGTNPSGRSYNQNQGNYSPEGYAQTYPQHAGNEYQADHVDPNMQHPVYEYMLGKDGKWHQAGTQNNGNDYNSGYSDSKDSRKNKIASPESYPLNENYPNAPRHDNQQMQRNGYNKNRSQSSYQPNSYDSNQDYSGNRWGDTSSSYNTNRTTPSNSNQNWNSTTASSPNQNWNTEAQNLDQQNYNTGSSSNAWRNAQR
jgi:hypothetical protein